MTFGLCFQLDERRGSGQWQDRILTEDLDPNTANKDFGHLSKMLKTVDLHHRLALTQVFTDLRFEGGHDNSRTPFAPEFLRDRILAPGALSGLNGEARGIVHVLAETGLRLSEAVNLNERTIVLDGEIPYVMVRPDGRRMKTSHSRRDIPLVGIALEAVREHPHGFVRYRDRASSLSALVNKYMEVHDLRPTKDHTLYSLRHTFKDRLRDVEAPDDLVDELMGHATGKPRYGSGHGLRLKHKWLLKMAFPPIQ